MTRDAVSIMNIVATSYADTYVYYVNICMRKDREIRIKLYKCVFSIEIIKVHALYFKDIGNIYILYMNYIIRSL